MGSICSQNTDSNDIQPNGRSISKKNMIGIKTYSINKDYEFERNLGYGSYGEVKLGKHRKTKNAVAIKKITVMDSNPEVLEMIKNEIYILIECDHPNIIKIQDAFTDTRFYYIVEEYMPKCATLTSLFAKEKKFDEEKRTKVLLQILRALTYMEDKKIVHRDLKPDNIVYSVQDSAKEIDIDKIQLKLIDFGFSKQSNDEDLNEFLGTPFYIAPEIVKKEKYGCKCDIWSLGVIAYLILTGNLPFDAKNKDELFERILEGDFDQKCSAWLMLSNGARDFIEKCLTVDPNARPRASELINHPWIKNQALKQQQTLSLNRTQLSFELKDNLEQIMKSSQFQKTIITYMNSLNLNQQEIVALRNKFQEFDENSDGTLEIKEIKQILMLSLDNQSFEEYEKFLYQMDSDSSGKIDYSEFLSLLTSKKNLLTDENLRITFKALDYDNNGEVTIQELRRAFEFGGNQKTDQFWKKFIEEVDVNKDGIISFEEFRNAMMTVLNKLPNDKSKK